MTWLLFKMRNQMGHFDFVSNHYHSDHTLGPITRHAIRISLDIWWVPIPKRLLSTWQSKLVEKLLTTNWTRVKYGRSCQRRWVKVVTVFAYKAQGCHKRLGLSHTDNSRKCIPKQHSSTLLFSFLHL